MQTYWNQTHTEALLDNAATVFHVHAALVENEPDFGDVLLCAFCQSRVTEAIKAVKSHSASALRHLWVQYGHIYFFVISGKCGNASVTRDLDSEQCCAADTFTVLYSDVG